MDAKEKEIKKGEENKEEIKLMTQEEFAEIQRLKTKKNIYRFAMVAGVIGIFLLVLAGIFEPLFEMTYFGRLFKPDKYKLFWGTDAMGTDGLIRRSGIYSDWLKMGTWLPKCGITLIYLGVIVGIVCFFTYVFVDIINLLKSGFRGIKRFFFGLHENVKVTYKAEKDEEKNIDIKKEKKEKKEKVEPVKVVEKKEKPKKEIKEKPAKEPKNKRREEDEFDDAKLQAMLLSGDQSGLDAIYNNSNVRTED